MFYFLQYTEHFLSRPTKVSIGPTIISASSINNYIKFMEICSFKDFGTKRQQTLCICVSVCLPVT